MAPSPHRVRQSWSPEAYALARQARSLNFLKIEPLIQKLQQASGRSRRDCLVLIHRCAQEQPKRRSWSDEEIDQVRVERREEVRGEKRPGRRDVSHPRF